MSAMDFFLLFLFVSLPALNFALQLNLYSSIGQVRQEISLKNGLFETYLSNQEYNDIVPGTIDFPGQQLLEQDLYNSNERLRNADVYIRFAQCDSPSTSVSKGKLLDPHALLVQHDSLRYSYVLQHQIEFKKDPLMNGMILSIRLNDTTRSQSNMTYLTFGLSWMARYEVVVSDDQSATLRALADINNNQERFYDITSSQLITGTVPLVASSDRLPSSTEKLRVEYMAAVPTPAGGSSSISSTANPSTFGTYSYNITRPFILAPKSIKTFPFISPTITFNYTLETTKYVSSSGTITGQFQRIFTLQPSEFLPAGTVTFYSAATGACLGQGYLPDTAKKSEQKVTLGNDPDVQFTINSVITATRQSAPYGQDLNVDIAIMNRKDKQAVLVTLKINGGYPNTILTLKTKSSSDITIRQDSNNNSTLIIQAMIKPNREETCSFALKQFN